MDDTSKKTKDGVEGEGSYSGTRDYNQRTAEFIKKGKAWPSAPEPNRPARAGGVCAVDISVIRGAAPRRRQARQGMRARRR